MNTPRPILFLSIVATAFVAALSGCASSAMAPPHLHPIAAFEPTSTRTLVRGSNAIEVTQTLGWPDKPTHELWVYPRVFTGTTAGHDDCQTLVVVMIDGSVRDLFRANERGVARLSRELAQAGNHGIIVAAEN